MEHLRKTTLFRSAIVTVHDYCCRATQSACGPKEEADVASLAIPRRGVYVKHVGGEELVGDAVCAMFFNPGEPYRVSHPLPGGDDCTSFHFSKETLCDALSTYGAAACDDVVPRFDHSHGPLDSATFLSVQRLRRDLLRGQAEAGAVEETALAILDCVLRQSYASRDLSRRGRRPATQRAHREWTEGVRCILNDRVGERLLLAEIARGVHCSPFHLVRVFKQHTGASIHEYRVRLRLRLAVERLLQGERNLTALALELGFASHAHFCDSFRREFARPPSRLRHDANSFHLHEMSKNLEA